MNDASPVRKSKFAAYRARKKAAGLREVRLWIPDLHNPGIRAEIARQTALIDRSEDEREASDMMQVLAEECWDVSD